MMADCSPKNTAIVEAAFRVALASGSTFSADDLVQIIIDLHEELNIGELVHYFALNEMGPATRRVGFVTMADTCRPDMPPSEKWNRYGSAGVV